MFALQTAAASGQPSSSSNVTNIAAAVSGSTVTHYKHKLGSSDSIDCAASTGYSVETAVATPIAEDISSLADGSITLCLIGRNNIGTWQSETSSTYYSWIKDTVGPNVIISATQDPGPTNASNLNLTVIFSKPVTGFDLTDMVVTGGTKSSLSGSGTTYTLTINSTTSSNN